jgi:SAM-dependent methyltransferase
VRATGPGRAGDFDYEVGGVGYAAQRRTDARIAALVHAALGSARSVVNVGAGAGSYEPADRDVIAVEPAASMRAQRPGGSAPVVEATAEALPFADDAFDAAMAMVTIHQWSDTDRGLREMRRVARGPVVLLTFDPSALDSLWLAEYAPEIIDVEQGRYPAIEHVCRVLRGHGVSATVAQVPIPIDCVDGFTEAYYARPEHFLDPAVRRSQSCWGFVGEHAEQRSMDRLRRDLDSGEWDRRYGVLRTQPEFTGALRLVSAVPAATGAVRAAPQAGR